MITNRAGDKRQGILFQDDFQRFLVFTFPDESHISRDVLMDGTDIAAGSHKAVHDRQRLVILAFLAHPGHRSVIRIFPGAVQNISDLFSIDTAKRRCIVSVEPARYLGQSFIAARF